MVTQWWDFLTIWGISAANIALLLCSFELSDKDYLSLRQMLVMALLCQNLCEYKMLNKNISIH